MREIVLDTETTGLDPSDGDRLVEIGCVELINLIPAGEFHIYINPERDVPQAAFEIHGLSEKTLSGYPVFEEQTTAFLDFIADSPLVIHNAGFDMKFLNAELAKAGCLPISSERVVDTLLMARKKFPGQQNSLDALCRRFNINNTHRELHGALLDSRLLAQVYVELRGGRQTVFDLSLARETAIKVTGRVTGRVSGSNQVPVSLEGSGFETRKPRFHVPSEAEKKAHMKFLAGLKDPIWLR